MADYIGHDRQKQAFSSASQGGKLHHGWILSGPRGLGKAGFARKAAAQLVDPENLHAAMIEHGNHPDIKIVTRPPKEAPKEGEGIDPKAELKRSIGVDQIRSLQVSLNTRPGMGACRAIIIDSADDMEIGAANALLKSLEEPPIGTYFFLISHASDRLLPTIRSRCQILRFEPLSDAQMEQAIRQSAPDVSDAELISLLAAGGGSPGKALEFAGLDLGDLESIMNDIIAHGDSNNKLRSNLADKLALKAAQPRYEAFLRRVPQIIAQYARGAPHDRLPFAIHAWSQANTLASRAISLSLDKQSITFQMGSLLAGLQAHKQRR